MKKLMALLLCVLMVSCLCTAVMADEGGSDEMVPVLAQVPAGWADPCCWAWADDGTNAFAAWPGGQMEPRLVLHICAGLRAERHNQRE